MLKLAATSSRAWCTRLLLAGSILAAAMAAGNGRAAAADGAPAAGGDGAAGHDVAWIEAENPTTKPDIAEFEMRPHGTADFLSGGKVAFLSIDERHTHKVLGDAGKTAAWDFATKAGGKHEVWARIGFEWVRSDFDWRIDDGAWQTAKHTDATTDMQQLAFWCEIAWLKLGEQDLPAGKHSLQIRWLPTHEDDKGKQVPGRTLWMADSFVIADHFSPNHHFRPDEDFQSDKDRAAAAKVFTMAAPAQPGERAKVDLTGDWQLASWDELAVSEDTRLEGVDALPAGLDQMPWYSIPVPSDRNASRPDFIFNHRLIYRTRVNVPAELKDHGFFLDFDSFSMIATVFVNGQKCGWSRNPYTGWQCDVTGAVKPGQVNDIAVVIKDLWYAQSTYGKDPLGARKAFNMPPGFIEGQQGTTMTFDMPMSGNALTGLFRPVALVAAGTVYADDVFAKTSVKKHELGLEITLHNTGAATAAAHVDVAVVPWSADGKPQAAVQDFGSDAAAGPGDTVINLTQPWNDPKLWWPDEPNLYEAVTTISVGGKPVDVRRTRFGFREWEWAGNDFKLNGIVKHLWATTDYDKTPQLFMQDCKRTGQNMIRLWGPTFWGESRRDVLDFCDENGMLVRSQGIFDGEGCNYRLALEGGKPNQPLFDHWRDQLAAWVRTERNHPSVFIWSVENEITYINSCNFGLGKIVEPEIRKGAAMVEAIDPTRPTMTDGGRALADQSMPVNGCHYNECFGRDLPDNAYHSREGQYTQPEHGPWLAARDKPIFHGECDFAVGHTPAEYSLLDGDRCFLGPAESSHGKGLYGRMLSEGWRWDGVAAFHFWTGFEDGSFTTSWQPVALFCRQWNWTFAGGTTVPRSLKVFNDTRFDTPIEASWSLAVGGKEVDGGKRTFNLVPGTSEEFAVNLKVPAGLVSETAPRTAATFTLSCTRGGVEVFKDVQQVAIIDPDVAAKPDLDKASLVVIDPKGTAKSRLTKRGIAFTEVADPSQVPATARVVVVGADAISADEASDTAWLALAARGERVVVLDQANPLKYQAIPGDLEPTDHTGSIAFAEDLNHPVLAGLDQSDFFCWSGDEIDYRNAYQKGSKGFRSLVQCDLSLGDTALAECQVNEGLMLLCQVAVGTKLADDAVAQRLFDNLIDYAADYRAEHKTTALAVDPASPKGKLLAASGLQFTKVDDPLAAIDAKYGVAVVDATPANLKVLATHVQKVRDFTNAGGWLMLWGLTAEGLADYNTVVGFTHVIRPFQMERVALASPRDPFTAGLSLRDVVMDSGKEIFNYMSLKFPAEDEFTSIVDYDEVGPFITFPSNEELGQPKDSAPGWDHWSGNMVNNFTSDDCWRFAYMIAVDSGQKTKWTMELPQAEELTSFGIVPNVIYDKITRINFYFDEDPTPFSITLRPVHDRQDFPIVGKQAKKITMEIADWEKSGAANVIGIDNMWIGVKRSPEFIKTVHPLLNIGGLVRYNEGKGGILLNDLNIIDSEVNPVNAEKKATITKTLLKNLGATFAGGSTVVVGANLVFAPIDFAAGICNAYTKKDAKPAWFKHGADDLSALPVGEQKMAGVTWHLPDFRTSPVPSVIMLKGNGSDTTVTEVTGIKVGVKADALFFLHTFNANGQAMSWKPTKDQAAPVAFTYIIHYSSGKQVTVPVAWSVGIGNWVAKQPGALPGAQVAWKAPLSGNDDNAVVYSMQWNNPDPLDQIDSIDFRQDEDKWGCPALLAVTAATVGK